MKPVRSAMADVLIFGGAVFTGAFLLFQVQPLLGKFIVPRLGGGPEVWGACLLFFQVMLLAGYVYVHLVCRYLPLRGQVVAQAGLCLAALVCPLRPPSLAVGAGESAGAAGHVLILLLIAVGAPYFLLATTGPLLQRWWHNVHEASPYRFYAWSNAASMLALVSYPIVIEPWLTRRHQVAWWSAGLVVYILLLLAGGVILWRRGRQIPTVLPTEVDTSLQPGAKVYALWLILAALGCLALLAVTNKISQDIAAIPLMWVGPLAIYLLSFVLCFHSERWHHRRFFFKNFILLVLAVSLMRLLRTDLGVIIPMVFYLALLFAMCMVCHGQLYRLRPAAERLTGFYLMIALGGVLGSAFVVGVAPFLFNSYFEFYLGILLLCVLVVFSEPGGREYNARRWGMTAFLCLLGVMVYHYEDRLGETSERRIWAGRNFFGMLRIAERNIDQPRRACRVLQHGTTIHGVQFLAADLALRPTGYYHPGSGVGLALRNLQHQRPSCRIGVVGLGAGCLAAYGRQGELWRFYEINPAVVRVAQEQFTFLRDTLAQVEIIPGDARVALEQESPQQYDLLILDAFSGDAMPVHLLTREALLLYQRHLRPGGVMAFHASNNYLNLAAVAGRLADDLGLWHTVIGCEAGLDAEAYATDWVLVAPPNSWLQAESLPHSAVTPPHSQAPLWTDDYSSVLSVLK